MTGIQNDMWHRATQETRKLVDDLDMPVDKGIVETVAILRLMGVPTTMSCAGHLDRTTSGPYVKFRSPQARKWEMEARNIGDETNANYKRLRRNAIKVNLLEVQRLLPYLDDFYRDRHTPHSQCLIIKSFGPLASYLMCQGADLAHIVDEVARRKLLRDNRAEMHAFTEFLKEHYFSAE